MYYRSGNYELATDITQETFVKVWEKQFDNKDDKIKSLLYKIAGEMFISHLRREKNAKEYIKEIKLRFSDDYSDTDENNELKQKYEKALTRLPDKQRVVLLMNKMDGLTYKEIAENLNLGVKAVEKRMSSALKTLKKEVKG